MRRSVSYDRIMAEQKSEVEQKTKTIFNIKAGNDTIKLESVGEKMIPRPKNSMEKIILENSKVKCPTCLCVTVTTGGTKMTTCGRCRRTINIAKYYLGSRYWEERSASMAGFA
jgi:hypothetical protein